MTNHNADQGGAAKDLAYALITDDEVTMSTPYDPVYVDALKNEVPTWARRYDRPTRRWSVSQPYVGAALDAAASCFELLVEDRRPKALTGWARAMFEALPDHLHKAVYRSVLAVVNPDVGGDEAAARELTAAFERRQTAAS